MGVDESWGRVPLQLPLSHPTKRKDAGTIDLEVPILLFCLLLLPLLLLLVLMLLTTHPCDLAMHAIQGIQTHSSSNSVHV